MFTGIIEEVGKVASIRKGAQSCVLTISAHKVLEDVHLGDSIATNGVCLTVTDFSSSSFSADVMHETLDRSSLGKLKPGSPVNLERAMAAQGRFGGHIVSGHIDGVGTISSLKEDDNAVWYTIKAPQKILTYIIEKGSITIDGISLTVARVTDSDFSVSIIPHTRAQTNLSQKKAGDIVNLENDLVGKYVEKMLCCSSHLVSAQAQQSAAQVSPYVDRFAKSSSKGITKEFLAANGF